MEKDNQEIKIDCEKHGKCSAVEYSYNGELIKRVCFLCYAEKQTEGLKDYKRLQIIFKG